MKWASVATPALAPEPGEPILPLEDLSEQVWQAERRKSGKRPWQWIEIEVDRCMHVYGQAPCTAAGADQCYNSWQTCQDQPNFASEPFWLRFAEAAADAPRLFGFDEPGLAAFAPLLRSVDHTPQLPEPGEHLGLRVTLSATLEDAPHHDRGIDKYVASRSFDPMEQGTMLRKLRTRFPHYTGRRLRWYQGYITDAPGYADFRRREYVMERFEGPDPKGRVRIIAKDPLKLIDDERAQAPRKSKGTLLAALASGSSPATIDIVTTDTAEYDLKAGESVDYVRIGEEIIQYTGTSVVSGNVRLSGLTYAAPSPYTTVRANHAAGDEVQRCRLFSGTIPAVVRQLLVDYAGIDAAYIPLSEWETEANDWLASETVARLVTEPEGVKSLVNEIIGQTLVWGFWFDEIARKIKFRGLRPADVGDNVVAVTDAANLVADSVRIVDEPDKLVNEVQVLYGQIDPTQPKDEVGNYRNGLVLVDADSQSSNETGQRRIKRIFARWRTSAMSASVQAHAQRTLTARARNLMTIEFRLERKDENLDTADFADLTTLYLIDQFGQAKSTRVQVMRVDASGELVSYKAREDFFANTYGRWAPVELTGLTWADATAEQRLRYLFWAGANGKFSNGDEGKLWL